MRHQHPKVIESPLGFEVGLPLLAQVASGLQAAHDQGVTHRDVKPANIVLNAAPEPDGTRPDLMAHPELGHPVLVDFGIARLVDESGTQLTRPAIIRTMNFPEECSNNWVFGIWAETGRVQKAEAMGPAGIFCADPAIFDDQLGRKSAGIFPVDEDV